MDKTYKLIEVLWKHINLDKDNPLYIVQQDNVTEKLGSTYITYKVIATDIDDLRQEQMCVEDDGENVIRTMYKQYQETISFSIISDDDLVAYNHAKHLKNLLTYGLHEHLSSELDIVVVDVSPITDVSVRLVDVNSYRYNVDLRIRKTDIINREVGKIEKVNVRWGYGQ